MAEDVIPAIPVWRKNDTPICGVYVIECLPTGRAYVGSSVNITRRWANHLACLRNDRHHCTRLQDAWMEYGESKFSFSIIEIVEEKDLSIAEQKWINACDRLLNAAAIVDGGRGTGWKHTEASRKKISRALKGRKFTEKHKAALWRNRVMSEETRQKLIAANLGRVGTMTGKKHSTEALEKMRAFQNSRDWSTHPHGEQHYRAREVEIDGVKYATVNAAADAFGLWAETIIKRIKRGMGRYTDDPNSKQTIPFTQTSNKRPVFVGELYFESATAAAKHFNVDPALILYWAKTGKARYADGLPAGKQMRKNRQEIPAGQFGG